MNNSVDKKDELRNLVEEKLDDFFLENVDQLKERIFVLEEEMNSLRETVGKLTEKK